MGRQIVSASANEEIDQTVLQSMMQQGPRLANARIIMLHGDVTEYSVSQVMAQILEFASLSTKPIQLVVSSYGGSVHELFGLCDLIKTIESPIHTIGLGKIMSAGTVLMAAGEKGKRLIGASTRVMMHPVSGGAQGTVFDIINQTKEIQALQNTMIDMMLQETKMTKKQLEDIMKQGYDHYLTAEEAVSFGIADKIIGK